MLHCHASHGPRTPIFLARVAHGDGKAVEEGHGGQVLGHLTRANQQHAVFGTKGVDELMLVDVQFTGGIAGNQGDQARLEIGASLRQLPSRQHVNQLSQAGRIGIELEQQLEGATTGQTKAVRFIGTDAVFQAHWRAVCDGIGFAVLCNQIVFNAAARY